MDFDLKIGAVFSLADADKKNAERAAGTGSAEDTDLFNTPDFLLPDKDSDEVDIMFDGNPVPPSIGASQFPSCYTTDSNSVKDPDVPPPLLLEEPISSGLPEQSPLIEGKESMSPPLLQREMPEKKGIEYILYDKYINF